MRTTVVFALLGMVALATSRAQAQSHHCPPNFEAGHTVDFYDVVGTTREDLGRSLRERGPKGVYGMPFHGRTIWCVRWDFVPWKRREGCELVHVSTTLRTRITLPRWVDREDAPPDLAHWWVTFIRVLKAHEDVHLANGRKAEAAIARALASVGPNTSCAAITQMANRVAHELYRRHRTGDQQFDRETRHGLAQLEEALLAER